MRIADIPPLREQLNDPELGVAAEFVTRSAPLLLSFAGMSPGGGSPSFELVNLTEGLGFNRVFIRDFRRAWYHRGVRGLGGSVDEVASELRTLIVDTDPPRTLTFGNSAGGFAALLFGWLLETDAALAFNPRTTFEWTGRLRNRDVRYWRDWVQLLWPGRMRSRYKNLRRLFESGENTKTQFFVHYSTELRKDVRQARLLAGIDRVDLITHDRREHGVVRQLRDDGVLRPMVVDLLRPVGMPERGAFHGDLDTARSDVLAPP